MKVILQQVTACVNSPGQQHPGTTSRDNNNRNNGGSALNRSHDTSVGMNATAGSDSPDVSLEDLDATRKLEISAKAVTGILLLLLKWLKISRGYCDARSQLQADHPM